ncbi:MAG TPA: SMC-Scp complex subunit ScpB [Puia sp.]|nr:SMC-Scp complex subunit ScpB [Puia sp.]
MEIGNIIPHIEALIFASDKPLTSMEITELINNAFGFMEEKLTLEQIQTSLDGIIEKYASEFYPFEVRESGGGWQFLTKKDFHKTVAQLNGEKFLKRLSSAALETLAIIAYKQPITKGEIEAIRGVSSDYSIQKLLEKELIIISGRNEDMPGKPLVYSTSKTFMDYFGINSAADLPKLKEIFAETIIEPTVITHGAGETLPERSEDADAPASPDQPAEGSEEGTADAKLLIVGEDGQLIEHLGETAGEEADEVADEPGDEQGDYSGFSEQNFEPSAEGQDETEEADEVADEPETDETETGKPQTNYEPSDEPADESSEDPGSAESDGPDEEPGDTDEPAAGDRHPDNK